MTTEEIRSATLPEVPGILTSADVLATGHAIAAVQRHDGQIPWFEGGHCDPWNHVEAAMSKTSGSTRTCVGIWRPAPGTII